MLLKKALANAKKRSQLLSEKLKQTRAENKELHDDLARNNFMQKHSALNEEQFSKDNDSSLMSSMNNLSLASLNVPECKPAEGEEEIDKKSFVQWKDLLEASMELVGATDEFTKMRIFKTRAGSRLLDVLYGTPTSGKDPDPRNEPYSNAMKRLQNFHGSRDYLLVQRQKLRCLVQESTETDTKYVKRVIAAAKLCDFGEEQLLENVCHIIQSQATNIKIREIGRKVLRKGGTLANLLDKIIVHEVERINEEIYTTNHQQVKRADVAAVSFKQEKEKVQDKFADGFSEAVGLRSPTTWPSARGRGGFLRRGTTRNPYYSRNFCWRCTSRYHSADECSVAQKVCRNCNTKGHIERACRSSIVTKRKSSNLDEATPSKVKKIAAITKNEYFNEEQELAVSE